jgi:hypothetical protein
MNRIQILMSADRGRCGSLRLFGAGEKLLAGPFAVAARATDRLAAANGNPGRNPLFRYGDTPSGTYRLLSRQPTGGRHGFAADEYGAAGIILLRPVAGDAALAEANGRYIGAIIGGEPAASGRLRSTAGAFRLANADLRALIKALGKTPEGVICQCNIAPPAARAARVEDAPCLQTDPISAGLARPVVSRREALLATAGAAGAFAARGAITFVTLGALAPAARAYNPIDHDVPNLMPAPPAIASGSSALQDLRNATNTGTLFDGSTNQQITDASLSPDAPGSLLPQVADDPAVDAQAETVDNDDSELAAAAATYVAAQAAWNAIKTRPDAPADEMSAAFAAFNQASGQYTFAKAQQNAAVAKLVDAGKAAAKKRVQYVLDRNKPATD